MSGPVARTRSAEDRDWEDQGPVARLMSEGGDERIVLDPESGRNAYGCGGRAWTGGPTFSSTTASPLYPESLDAARRMLAELGVRATDDGACTAVAQQARTRLAALLGLVPGRDADIVLAPSGTDLHWIAAACARSERGGPLITVMPTPVESGRGVANAVRGLAYAAHPPFERAHERASAPAAGEVIAVPLRGADAQARPLAAVDQEIEAACERAMRSGQPVLLVVLDVSKTGLAAPSAECAARLKARYGERLTVLVDACQFRLGAEAVRRHLQRGLLVALTGSKFLAGPAFSGALLVPAQVAGRLHEAALPWREMTCSAREDWPEAYPARVLLPAGFSVGAALRWSSALETLAALGELPAGASAAFVQGFGAELAARLHGAAESFELLAPPPGGEATIFPLLLKRQGRPLDAEAVTLVHARLTELARARNAGHLWLGQPVTVGRTDDAPLAAVRLALGAPHLIANAALPDGVGRLMTLADECLWEIARAIDAL